jgi:hypothetical protein
MKKHERNSLIFSCCALLIGTLCATLAPLGCTGGCMEDDGDCSSGGTGGVGGVGGAAGTGGSPEGGGGTGGSSSSDASGAMCGGIANIQCPDPNLAYCDFDDKITCGQGDMAGTCMPRPDVCPKDCPGVCGCDGKFYCNACEAHRAGTDDSPTGTCSDASTPAVR